MLRPQPINLDLRIGYQHSNTHNNHNTRSMDYSLPHRMGHHASNDINHHHHQQQQQRNGTNAGNQMNITNMKQRLDLLLKQTEDYGAARGNGGYEQRGNPVTERLPLKVVEQQAMTKGYMNSTKEMTNHSTRSGNVGNGKENLNFRFNISEFSSNYQSGQTDRQYPNKVPTQEIKDSSITFDTSSKYNETQESSYNVINSMTSQVDLQSKSNKSNRMFNGQATSTLSIESSLYNDQPRNNLHDSNLNLENKMKIATYSNQISPSSSFQGTGFTSTSTMRGSGAFGLDNYSRAVKKQQPVFEIPTSLYECQNKLKLMNFQNKKLKEELKEMTESKEYYRKQLSQQWRNNKKSKDQLQAKIVQMQAKHQNQRLSLEQKLRKKQYAVTELINKLTAEKKQIDTSYFDKKAQEILAENKNLLEMLQQKQEQISQYKQTILDKQSEINQLENIIETLEKQLEVLNSINPEQFLTNNDHFAQILKNQRKNISDFKQAMQKLNTRNNQLRQQLLTANHKIQSLSNQIRIQQLKHKSILNSQTMTHTIQTANRDNDHNQLHQKMMTLEERYKAAIRENKNKDEFIKQHLGNRTNDEEFKRYIENVIDQYRQTFPESFEDELKVRLEKAMGKLELYERYE